MSSSLNYALSSLPRRLARSIRACQPFLLTAALGMMVLIFTSLQQAQAASRLKDVVDFEGVRDNMLVGYGLVVGLNGSGDTLTNSPFTERSLIGMLERLGINETGDFNTIKTKNIAAVMVTATLPPFAAQGARIDVTVGTMGDAKSLQGGVLLVTPLQGADGEVYRRWRKVPFLRASVQPGKAVLRSRVVCRLRVVSPTARLLNAKLISGSPTSAPCALPCAILTSRPRNVLPTSLINISKTKSLNLSIPAAVRLQVPQERRGDVVGLMTEIEQLPVQPDQIARVVIDEQSGVIVMGENVHINTVAIAQGNLTIRISETPQVSQPGPLSEGGTTTVVQRSDINIDEGKDNKLALLKSGVSLQDLVQGLNALGIGPRDMISILQSIKASGALQADLELM